MRPPKILYDRRNGFGGRNHDQLRLYINKPDAPMGRITGSSLVISAVLTALEASPELKIVPLNPAPNPRPRATNPRPAA